MSVSPVRRDIWGLSDDDVWHPIIEAYALGVGELQRRDPNDPTGWRYQAAIHGLPPGQSGDAFRNQCQHFCWFFLPWHRLYLHYFERIVRAAIQTLPQVDDLTKEQWALPYWNYEGSDRTRSLPPAFRQPTLSDGSTPNPLFVTQRKPGRNDGDEIDATEVSSAEARLPTTFSLDAPAGGFGGAATGWNHTDQDFNSFPGPLERTPHGSVHVEVGGFMGRFETAGLDPIFWLHHCNVDRLWEVWVREDQGHVNPPEGSAWYTLAFDFHDETGAPVQGSSGDTVDTPGLGYTYESTEPPPPTRRGRRRASMPSQPPEHPPELVGATEQPTQLSGGRESVSFEVGRPTGPAARRGAAKPARVYLAVEGIEGDTQPGITYSVYVNLPDDDDPDADPETFYVGNLSFFGIERVGKVDSDRPGGHGLRHSFDITDIVEELDELDRWNPDEVKVTFSPVGQPTAGRRSRGAGAEAEAETAPVKLGRVGLYIQ
ncbi:MAG: tyrosinase family protein [Actinomycetota bacterium]|nr:tyrosinase family protein [Actinomycetota bacterium]